MTPKKNNTLLYLFVICLFGAITRIWFFWKDGLHVDEKYTFDLVVNKSLWEVVWFSLNNDCNPPLFYAIDWLSIHALRPSIFAERLPAVICGILLIPATYLFGKELHGETLGLLSALAVSTLGSIWYYSQFGRAYMLECLLFAVLCIYYIRLVRCDSRKENWYAVVGLSVLLAYTHLYAIIPLAFMFLWLLWQYRLKSLLWVFLTGLLSAPLILLFHAMWKWRMDGRGLTILDWYGAPRNQLIIFAPLEFFGYSFVFWVPMIVYATWKYRQMKEMLVLVWATLGSFAVLLAICDMTPVFLRYLMLLVPPLLCVGLLPVADFVDSSEYNKAQKWFIVGSFSVFYFAIIAFAFWSGLYPAKGNYFV